MKRALIVLLGASCLAGERADAQFAGRLARFHHHYNRFVRAYLGCTPGAREITECDPKLGSLDYTEFNAARREARKLFE